MEYHVLCDDKPASTLGYPNIHPSWNNHVFTDYLDACAYVHFWCNNISLDEAKKLAQLHPIPVNTPIDVSQGFEPLWMKIVEVS